MQSIKPIVRFLAQAAWWLILSMAVAAWIRSYYVEDIVLRDVRQNATANAPLRIDHQYAVVASSRGRLLVGVASRFYGGLSKDVWDFLMPGIPEGLHYQSRASADILGPQNPARSSVGRLGVDVLWREQKKDDVALPILSAGGMSQFLGGCNGITAALGGEHYSFYIVVPYWLIIACGISLRIPMLLRRVFNRRPGFPMELHFRSDRPLAVVTKCTG